jgi:hypothetical protein
MGILLLILAIIMLASLQYEADLKVLHDDYERWKRNRR